MITSLVQQIARNSGVAFAPVVFKPQLNHLIDQLPSIPADLKEYLDSCVLPDSYGNQIEFHGYERLLEENEALLPGCQAIKQGFICLAKEDDGSQFAYHCQDRKIYHLFEEVGSSASETISLCHEHWDTLEDFLTECI